MSLAPYAPQNNDDKLWAGFAYVGLMVLMIPTVVIFLMKKEESEFVKFCALQAMGLWVFSLIFGVASLILGNIPIFNIVSGLASFLIQIFLCGYWIYLMVMAFQGQAIDIPLLGEQVRKQFMPPTP